MKRKEVRVDTDLAELPDWVVGIAPAPAGLLPPVPPMDPNFGFTEAEWVRCKVHEFTAEARRAWLAKHAPDLTSRQICAERRARLAERTAR